MSASTTDLRPLARMGWGGRAASYWRGLSQESSIGPQGTQRFVRGPMGTVVYVSPAGRVNFALSGFTKDSAGAALASCKVELFDGGNISRGAVISGLDGSYSFSNPGSGPFYLVAYKQGSPDVAGTTVNTLQPAVV